MDDSVIPQVLQMQQHVRANRQRVFAAWTEPDAIVRWWGPAGVTCTHAEVDLRVGGAFRLANEGPDGSTVWISGVYEEIDPPHRLVHSWSIEAMTDQPAERVEITFTERDGGTDVTVTHTGIPTPEQRVGHRAGWTGCLSGLAELFIEDPQ